MNKLSEASSKIDGSPYTAKTLTFEKKNLKEILDLKD